MRFYDALNFEFAQRMTDKGIEVAGIAVMAADTGRVLMLQRALDDNDPASGMLEFPGGHLEQGEEPLAGAVREWKEEVGTDLPEGGEAGEWFSGPIYKGFLYVVPSESDLPINLSHHDRDVKNPDNPTGKYQETVIWMDPDTIPDNPAVRKEVRAGTDFALFRKVRRNVTR